MKGFLVKLASEWAVAIIMLLFLKDYLDIIMAVDIPIINMANMSDTKELAN